DQGIVIVAAAGNDSTTQRGFNMDETPMYPICDPAEENIILGVGTITPDGKKALFSNYGAKCLDLATYGSQFYSTEVYRLDAAYPQEFSRFY
ncbi:S8 family serine peptidase, partial [Pseudoneobacillus sp. C159]